MSQRIGDDNSHYFTMRVECQGRPPYQVVLRFPRDFKKFHEQIRGHPALAGYKLPKGISKVRNDKTLQKSEHRLQLLLITCLETPDLRLLFQAFLFEQHELELELPDRADRGRRRELDLAADPWGTPPPQRMDAGARHFLTSKSFTLSLSAQLLSVRPSRCASSVPAGDGPRQPPPTDPPLPRRLRLLPSCRCRAGPGGMG